MTMLTNIHFPISPPITAITKDKVKVHLDYQAIPYYFMATADITKTGGVCQTTRSFFDPSKFQQLKIAPQIFKNTFDYVT
jgi:hypothetical protein